MRAIWTGSISFGLINIPVKLYSGTEIRGGIDLRMLHKKDLSPIRYARICRQDGKEIPFEEIVKGYEWREGDYIVLEDSDFAKADAKRSTTIDIKLFCYATDIDLRYFQTPYFLEPAKGSDKPYALLRDSLAKSGKLAIAKFVLRNREHLAAIIPVDKALVLQQMHFTNELRSPAGLKLPAAGDSAKAEVDLAMKLIDQLTGPFIPEDFHDTYTEELEKIIEEKAKGKPIKARGKEPVATKTVDLMATLKASLEKQKK